MSRKPGPIPWKHGRIHKGLLFELSELYGRKAFTNHDAYEIYAVNTKHHLAPSFAFTRPTLHQARYLAGLPIIRMNVDNYLNTAVWRGILLRIKPGTYYFQKPFNPSQYTFKGEMKCSTF